MKRARIPELRNRLTCYLEHVRAGGTVIVLDRDRPIAEIRPIRSPSPRRPSAGSSRLDELEREGLIRRGTGRLPPGFLEELERRGPLAPGTSLVDALLEEREESP